MRWPFVLGNTALIISLILPGCGSQEEQLRQWQQQQVDQIQKQTQQNTEASRALVEADAQARRDLAIAQKGLQTERQQLFEARDAVEHDRRQIPLLANLLQGTSGLLIVALALAISFLLVRNLGHEEPSLELEEMLVLEIAGQASLLAEPQAALPACNGPTANLPQPPGDEVQPPQPI